MTPLRPEQRVVAHHFQNFLLDEYPGEEPDRVFAAYAATQTLKPHELTSEELAAGDVDGSGDGGIDNFYVFLNGALLRADDPILDPSSQAAARMGINPLIEAFAIQAKNTASWSESTWEHLTASLAQLLDWDESDAQLEQHFNTDVVEQTGIFRRVIESLGIKFPRVIFHTIYVTQAPESNISDTVRLRSVQVQNLISSRLPPGAEVHCSHVGVEGLYGLAAQSRSTPATLRFRNLIRESGSYVGIVAIKDYLEFVRGPDGDLRDDLFDSNVRDYEGDNSVNEAIATTLGTIESAEFWWLNNGVTVLGTQVTGPQQTLTVDQPLIVNGLQTTHVLHRVDKAGRLITERLDDGIVVRVIESDDEDTRDRVIAGTNRQTQVPTPALYATQKVQRDIERYLLVFDWYYERRKNRYKNQGKPAKRRVTINLLAQAMITLQLGQPDAARARPSTILSRAAGYDSIFPDGMSVEAYRYAIELVKGVDEYLATTEATTILDEYSNTRFYVVAGYALVSLKTNDYSKVVYDRNFRKLSSPLKKERLNKVLATLAKSAEAYQADNPKTSRDSVFKSADFRDKFFAAL
jgi:hypothetical protein